MSKTNRDKRSPRFAGNTTRGRQAEHHRSLKCLTNAGATALIKTPASVGHHGISVFLFQYLILLDSTGVALRPH
jgi:hypothetical protein